MQLNLKKIDRYDKKFIAEGFLRLAEEFYSNPENVIKFEKWLEAKQKKTQNAEQK